MKPVEDELRGIVAGWVRKADLDLDVVARLIGEGDRFRDVVAFHSQQAAEKYLKALLVRHQVEFPKTHDIERLLRILRTVKPEIADSLVEANWLSPFGAGIRYPGDFPQTHPGDEMRALHLAQRVRHTVMAVLTPYLSGG